MTDHYGLPKRFQGLSDDLNIVHGAGILSQGSGDLHRQGSSSQEIADRKSEWYGHGVC
jgi:hypothetical protein